MTSSTISAAFPFESHYVDVLDSKLHYVDEGAGDPVLFLHGQPTSSYLWRNIIPHLIPYARCVAPDLIGFGKSGKPDIEYGFFDHAKYLDAFIEALGLKNITFVVHDWGSALGFHYFARHQDNVKALAFMEAMLMPNRADYMDEQTRGFFEMLRGEKGWDMVVNQNLFVEQVIPNNVVRKLTDEEMNRYREPFLDPGTRKPIWRWPREVPIDGEPADVTAAFGTYHAKLVQSDVPKLLFHGSPGEVIPAALVEWSRQNLRNLKAIDIGPGLHFLPEDNPHLIGAELAEWYVSTVVTI